MEQHRDLLSLIKTIGSMVMISGYENDLYNSELKDWRKIQINTVKRSAVSSIETVWMNYDEPIRLHDYKFIGDNFRERERIKRKASRWFNRFEHLPVLERQAIMQNLEGFF